jgi:hypothetical protein
MVFQIINLSPVDFIGSDSLIGTQNKLSLINEQETYVISGLQLSGQNNFFVYNFT